MSASEPPSVPPPLTDMAPMSVPAFRNLWMTGVLNGTVRWIEILVVGVQVFEMTHSAFWASFVAMLRLLPIAACGVALGGLSGRFGHRRLYLLITAMLGCSTAFQAVLALSGRIEVWHLAVGALIAGIHWGADMPLRRTLMGEAVGPRGVVRGMALEATSLNCTRMLGPIAGGLALDWLGLSGAFIMSTLSHATTFHLVSRTARDRPQAQSGTGLLQGLLEGIRYARNHPRIAGTLAITLIFNVFGFPATSLIPVVGELRFELSASAIGLLSACEGLGALLGSLVIVRYAQAIRHHARLYCGGVLVYLFATCGFAAAPTPQLAACALGIGGLGLACFSTMQPTLILMNASPDMRTRAMGLLAFCIGLGPIGFLTLGWLAERLGPGPALALMAATGLLAWVETVRRWARHRRG